MLASDKYDHLFRGATEIFMAGTGVDWRWIKAQAIQESGLDHQAVSKAGAMGLMQLMPGTANEMQRRLGLVNDTFDPFHNILMGVAYDRRCWNVWRQETGIERIRFMLAAYNAGTGNIVKAQRIAEVKDRWASLAEKLHLVTGDDDAPETIAYVANIESIHAKLVAGKVLA